MRPWFHLGSVCRGQAAYTKPAATCATSCRRHHPQTGQHKPTKRDRNSEVEAVLQSGRYGRACVRAASAPHGDLRLSTWGACSWVPRHRDGSSISFDFLKRGSRWRGPPAAANKMAHLQQPRSYASRRADVTPLGVRSCSRQQPKRIRLSISAVSQPVGGPVTGEQLGSAASCPFSSAMQKLQGLGAANPSPVPDDGTVITPGPKALSLASLGDVFTIFTVGLHAAMLDYSQKYGPVCR